VTTLFQNIILGIILFPLLGGLAAGLGGKKMSYNAAHWITTTGVAISFVLSLLLFYFLVIQNKPSFDVNIYTWGISGSFQFNIGFLLDRLSASMMVVVNLVSLAVHIYSIGYMRGDPGYKRFFSYISLFTFAMLMLVSANNFLQLYFGWEGVGLVSYLLIGFWFNRETANFGSLKAFLINRVGDFGFLLGIALLFNYLGSMDYLAAFSQAPVLASKTIHILPNTNWSVLTVICILLFVGAMGKSAQMPLHVWLPESMEGPTPISALIHAATMVTAGVYMVARMSPLFEYSQTALSFILIVGATGALFTGILAIVQNDIKRIVAYSTLSQLGYMIAALGASAYAASIFHLFTHAFFKALLFLAAGSVIIAMHHEQDIRQMGNLKKYLPITYICFLIGALALAAIPPFAGFFSKDAIIDAIHTANIPGATYAYYCVLFGVFITSFYIFRAFFLVFHTKERMDKKMREHIHESTWVIWLPLVVLAILSIVSGAALVGKMLYQPHSLLGDSIFVLPQHNVLAQLALNYRSPWHLILDSVFTLPFYLGIAGLLTAWFCYIVFPKIPEFFLEKLSWLHYILVKKYGFDDFNQIVFAEGGTKLANEFFEVGDVKILDNQFVNGSGRMIAAASRLFRKLQSGYLYHYAFTMIIGLLAFLLWLLWK
jgi:NADH-quinone oxidoreductase subunit L